MLALGEMGRMPKCGTKARTPAATTGTTPSSCWRPAAASSGGNVVGATDKIGEQVTDKFYKVESFGRTLYHLLGIDPDTIVDDAGEPAGQADRRGRADHQGGDRVMGFRLALQRYPRTGEPRWRDWRAARLRDWW